MGIKCIANWFVRRGQPACCRVARGWLSDVLHADSATRWVSQMEQTITTTPRSRILRRKSADGVAWIPESGVRLSPQQGGAGDFRVVSSEVVPTLHSGQLRMYYECCDGPQSKQNSIRSAFRTTDLAWNVEPGYATGACAIATCHHRGSFFLMTDDADSTAVSRAVGSSVRYPKMAD